MSGTTSFEAFMQRPSYYSISAISQKPPGKLCVIYKDESGNAEFEENMLEGGGGGGIRTLKRMIERSLIKLKNDLTLINVIQKQIFSSTNEAETVLKNQYDLSTYSFTLKTREGVVEKHENFLLGEDACLQGQNENAPRTVGQNTKMKENA